MVARNDMQQTAQMGCSVKPGNLKHRQHQAQPCICDSAVPRWQFAIASAQKSTLALAANFSCETLIHPASYEAAVACQWEEQLRPTDSVNLVCTYSCMLLILPEAAGWGQAAKGTLSRSAAS